MVGEERFELSNRAFEARTVTGYITRRWSRRRESNPELTDLKSVAAASWATTGKYLAVYRFHTPRYILDSPDGLEPSHSVLQTDPLALPARRDNWWDQGDLNPPLHA